MSLKNPFPAPAVIYVLFHFAVILDAIIYHLFSFHINSMVLNLVFTKGGLETIYQGAWMEYAVIFIFAALSGVQFLIVKLSASLVRRRLNLKKIFAVLILFVLAEKLICAWGDLKNIPYIARNAGLFPLYQPLTLKHFSEKYLGIKVEKDVKIRISPKNSRLDYPVNPLEIKNPEKILI